MKILIVTNYFEPDQGAASIIMTRLAKKLQQRGHHVTILTSMPNYPHGRVMDGYRGKFVVTEERDGLKIIQTWLWATPSPKISRKFISQITFMITAILRGLSIPKPDVMLVEAAPIFTNLAGVFLSKIKQVPYVLDVHDLWPDHMLSVGVINETHPVYRAARWLVDRTYLGATAIIALTPYLERVIRGYLPPTDKVQTVYSGIDLQRFRLGISDKDFRIKYDFGNKLLISFIGILGTAYDCETMLETAKQFVERSDVYFVIMGTGTQKDFVSQRLAKGDLPNIRWIEWVNYDEIPEAWAATHIGFWALHNHPIQRGAISTKMFEAMASGVPVAFAQEGIGADILRESGAGLSVQFEDVDGLAIAIRRLLDDKAFYEQCSNNARAYAEQHFDAENTVQVYQSALMKASKNE